MNVEKLIGPFKDYTTPIQEIKKKAVKNTQELAGVLNNTQVEIAEKNTELSKLAGQYINYTIPNPVEQESKTPILNTILNLYL